MNIWINGRTHFIPSRNSESQQEDWNGSIWDRLFGKKEWECRVEMGRTNLLLPVLLPRWWPDYQDPEAHSSVCGGGRWSRSPTSPGHETQHAPKDPALRGSDTARAGSRHRWDSGWLLPLPPPLRQSSRNWVNAAWVPWAVGGDLGEPGGSHASGSPETA